MKRTYLGIDLGTSAMKMVLTDAHKRILGQITEEYQAVQQEGGICEIDPEIWFRAMERGICRILEKQDKSLVHGR